MGFEQGRRKNDGGNGPHVVSIRVYLGITANLHVAQGRRRRGPQSIE